MIEILSEYGFTFKIDSRLTHERSGARAFTIYLPHQYHAHWFEALKLVDKYLASELTHHIKPKPYSSDKTAKMVAGFNYIRYRNDRGPNGSYSRNVFNNACERSLRNPFRPALISLLHEIYDHDIQLYKHIAEQKKKKPFNENHAQQKISAEINARFGDNPQLEVDKSLSGCFKAAFLNILHTIPLIGWAVGAHKYSHTGSFFLFFQEKNKTT